VIYLSIDNEKSENKVKKEEIIKERLALITPIINLYGSNAKKSQINDYCQKNNLKSSTTYRWYLIWREHGIEGLEPRTNRHSKSHIKNKDVLNLLIIYVDKYKKKEYRKVTSAYNDFKEACSNHGINENEIVSYQTFLKWTKKKIVEKDTDLADLFINKEKNIGINNYVSTFMAMFGITGSGKTNSVAVLIEEYFKYNLGLTILDIEGEYYTLRQKYPILIIGGSFGDLGFNDVEPNLLAEIVLKSNLQIILDFSLEDKELRMNFSKNYLEELFDLKFSIKTPHQIIIEEAHEYLPQSKKKNPLKKVCTTISTRGRKRGLGVIFSTQRLAKIDKDVVSQSRIRFLHKVMETVDKRTYSDMLGISLKKLTKTLNEMENGDVIFLNNGKISHERFRLRQTYHPSSTPKIDLSNISKSRKEIKEIIAIVSDFMREKGDYYEDEDDRESLYSEINELENRIIDIRSEKNKEIKDLNIKVENFTKEIFELKNKLIEKSKVCCKCNTKKLRLLGIVKNRVLKPLTQFDEEELREILLNNNNLIYCRNCFISFKNRSIV
jgi:hypothetical protein